MFASFRHGASGKFKGVLLWTSSFAFMYLGTDAGVYNSCKQW